MDKRLKIDVEFIKDCADMILSVSVQLKKLNKDLEKLNKSISKGEHIYDGFIFNVLGESFSSFELANIGAKAGMSNHQIALVMQEHLNISVNSLTNQSKTAKSLLKTVSKRVSKGLVK